MTKLVSSTAIAKVKTLATFVVIMNVINVTNSHRLPAADVSRLIKDYVKQFLKQNQIDTHYETEDLAIKKAIGQKTKEFKSLTDENMPVETQENPEDMEYTSILESADVKREGIVFADPETSKDHIGKYKRLRRQIEKMLKTEEVSDKTKALVTRTLDQMISEMLSKQCTWKRAVDDKTVQSDKKVMITAWKEKWQNLIQQYSAASEHSDADGLHYKDMLRFLIKLREFFFEIHDELNSQSDRYKVKCQLVRGDKADFPKKISIESSQDVLREHPIKVDTSNNCRYLRICSDELKNFMMDFYRSLKETVDVTFKNYEEMHNRDITIGDSKGRSIVAKIKNMKSEIIEKVGIIFKKQIENLELRLHNNTRRARVEAIKTFLISTVDLIQKKITTTLKKGFKLLDSKLRFAVEQDLTATLGIELSNLYKHFSDKMCLVFQTCNGNTLRRSSDGPRKKDDVNSNELVKVNLELKNPFTTSAIKIRLPSDETHDRGYNRYQQITATTKKPKFGMRKYNMNVIVTRTTYSASVKPTSKTAVNSEKHLTKSTNKTSSTKRPTTATQSTESKSQTATTKASSTYTYCDYIRKMMAADKIKPLKTTNDLTTIPKQVTTKEKLSSMLS